MYSVSKHQNGMFTAYCAYQDGTEQKAFDNKADAITWLIKSAKAFNNEKITRKGITFHKWVTVAEVKLVPWDGKE